MKKISYRLVYNRKKHLNANGKALIQVEAYLTGQKAYFSTHIYVKPEQWDSKHGRIVLHPHEEALNRMLDEFLLNLQYRELEGWKQGKAVALSLLKTHVRMSFDKKKAVADTRKLLRKFIAGGIQIHPKDRWWVFRARYLPFVLR